LVNLIEYVLVLHCPIHGSKCASQSIASCAYKLITFLYINPHEVINVHQRSTADIVAVQSFKFYDFVFQIKLIASHANSFVLHSGH
jgi:hypothetical protein